LDWENEAKGLASGLNTGELQVICESFVQLSKTPLFKVTSVSGNSIFFSDLQLLNA
jgi:hypothetical protein